MNKKQSIFQRISALLLVVVLLTVSLSGCFFKKHDANDLLIPPDAVVMKLAEDKNIPDFDTNAFKNVEICFN